MMPQTSIEEVKIKINGEIKRYYCHLLHKNEKLVLVSHQMKLKEDFVDGNFVLQAGSYLSYGLFNTCEPFGCYKIICEDNGNIVYRFDTCRLIEISENFFSWLDLIIDYWVDEAGNLHILDLDEFNTAVNAGILSQKDLHSVSKARNIIESNFAALCKRIDEEIIKYDS